ncbi:MAG: hypothetical protein JXM71_09770 [Spirochaetales bacterium]|nr:hypothetical protein [Spirochaetales bacterium]
MLDTNAFDRILADPEVAYELLNRRDVRLLVSPVQLRELEAVPDEARRGRLLELAASLCATVGADVAENAQGRHDADAAIAAASAARCDVLVSDDRGLLEHASNHGVRVLDFDDFVRRIVFGRSR